MYTNDHDGAAVSLQSTSGWQSTEDATQNASHLTNTARKDTTVSNYAEDLSEDELRAIVNDVEASPRDKYTAAMVLQNRETEKARGQAEQATDPEIFELVSIATDPNAPKRERATAILDYSEKRGIDPDGDFPIDVRLQALQDADARVYSAMEAILLGGEIEELQRKGISKEALETLMQQPEFLRDVKSSMLRRVTDELLEGGWDDPVDLHSNANLPTFPVEGMPPVLRNMVEGLADELQVPTDLVAVMVLSTLAASLVGRVNVKVRGSWDEVVTLYALGLAETGNRKTAIMGQLNRPLLEAQKVIREQSEADRMEKMKEKAAADMRAKNAIKRANKETASMADFAEAAEAQAEADAIEVPGKPTLVLTDATPEAMVMRMQQNGERTAVFDAEGGGLLTMAGVRYGNANSSNIELLLKGHVGEAVSQTRVGRDDVDLDHPVITIGILSQPQTLRDLLSVPGSAGRGLVDRFLIAAPPDKLGYRDHCTTEVRPEVKDAYSALLVSYATALWTAEVQTLRFTADASDVIHAYQECSESRLRPGADLRDMGGFGSKLVGSAVRLAALHHLATYGAGAAFYSQVGAASAEWGIKVAEWSLEHYRYAVAMAGDIADVSDADRLLLWLKKKKQKQSNGVVAIRDIVRATNMKASQVDEAVALLDQHNWVRPVTERRKGAAGRPAKAIEVHPHLRDDME